MFWESTSHWQGNKAILPVCEELTVWRVRGKEVATYSNRLPLTAAEQRGNQLWPEEALEVVPHMKGLNNSRINGGGKRGSSIKVEQPVQNPTCVFREQQAQCDKCGTVSSEGNEVGTGSSATHTELKSSSPRPGIWQVKIRHNNVLKWFTAVFFLNLKWDSD